MNSTGVALRLIIREGSLTASGNAIDEETDDDT